MTRPRRILALGVHVFTASGVIWGFLALVAVSKPIPDFRAMMLWLAVSLFVDGIDGSIARRIEIERAAPRFSGAALDLVVDFLTYVIVPAYALVASGMLAPGWDIAAAIVILMTGALYFADNEMKTDDAWFKGFPAVWNLVVFYLFVLAPGPVATFVTVIVLGVLTFAPFAFVHPLRVATLRPLTLTLLVGWAILAIAVVWRQGEAVPWRLAPWETWTLSAVAVYFLLLGSFRRRPAPGSSVQPKMDA